MTEEEVAAATDTVPNERKYATVWYLGLVMGDRNRLLDTGLPRPWETKVELDLEWPVSVVGRGEAACSGRASCGRWLRLFSHPPISHPTPSPHASAEPRVLRRRDAQTAEHEPGTRPAGRRLASATVVTRLTYWLAALALFTRSTTTT